MTEQKLYRVVCGVAIIEIILGIIALTMLSLWAIIASCSGIVRVLS